MKKISPIIEARNVVASSSCLKNRRMFPTRELLYINILVYLFAAIQLAYLTGCFQEVPLSLHPENITIALGIHYFAIARSV